MACRRAARRSLRYPFAVLRDLAGGQLNLRAMGLVYTTLLSIIPAVALSFVVLRAFGLHRGLEPLILEFFRPVGASAGEPDPARDAFCRERAHGPGRLGGPCTACCGR